jgi:hypothetical protein
MKEGRARDERDEPRPSKRTRRDKSRSRSRSNSPNRHHSNGTVDNSAATASTLAKPTSENAIKVGNRFILDQFARRKPELDRSSLKLLPRSILLLERLLTLLTARLCHQYARKCKTTAGKKSRISPPPFGCLRSIRLSVYRWPTLSSSPASLPGREIDEKGNLVKKTDQV